MVLDISSGPWNARLLVGYTKISSNFSFLSKRSKAISVCWSKQPTSKSFQMCFYCIYLFKLYDKLIFLLLTIDLTNICSEISEIRLILWMVYTSSVEEVQRAGESQEKWVEINVLCTVDQDHQWWVIAVDHTSKFKAM